MNSPGSRMIGIHMLWAAGCASSCQQEMPPVKGSCEGL